MPKLAVVFGGSGFIGRNVVRELAQRGWRVRVAVRRPHLALHLTVSGYVGQIQLQQTNVRHRDSVAAALSGADAVVNLVGILFQRGKQRFQTTQAEAPGLIAELAAAAGVGRLVHISAVGAAANSPSAYGRSKWAGETAVREKFPNATILRPSIVFGPEDDFFNRFARMAQMLPALPLFRGGKTKFQPVYVDDVADAICEALARSDAARKIYELGGPRLYTFRALMEFLLKTIGRKRALVPVPGLLSPLVGLAGEAVGILPILDPPITRDQLTMLRADNVVTPGALGLSELGISPKTVEAIVPGYLVPYRKYGQFAELGA